MNNKTCKTDKTDTNILTSYFHFSVNVEVSDFIFDLTHPLLSATPSQPGSPEATAVGKEHVIIEWLKPESDGGSEISNYIVDKRETNSTR